MNTGERITLKELPAKHEKRKKRGYRFLVEGRLNGKRVRRYFKHGDKEQAELHLKELKTKASKLAKEDRLILSDKDLLEQAARAQRILKKYDATLEEAVYYFAASKEKQANLSKIPISKVESLLLDQKKREERSERYLRDLSNRLKIFRDAFDDRPLSSLTLEELEYWIAQRGNTTTQANYRRILNVLFSYALKRKIISANPLLHAFQPKAKTAIHVLTPEQVENLLLHCANEVLPAVAIAFFAGLRDAEIDRLTWESIDLKAGIIRVGADVSKNSSVRIVHISENLKEWLMPHMKLKGSVRPDAYTWRKQWELARRGANLLENWPHNAARHSYASYHIALTGNEGETATQLGHGSLQMVRQHYKALVTPKDAEAYFNIRPSSKEIIELFTQKGAIA